MTHFDLTHARHDRAHCLCPGLFRSLRRGDRKKQKLDVTYDYGNERVRFVGFEPLGADDMRLLQTLVAYSGPSGILLRPDPQTDAGRQLRLFLDPRLEAAEQDALVVKEPLTRILCEMGLTDGAANLRAIRQSLTRMSSVSVIVQRQQATSSYHLLSYTMDDGRILVALNPRITRAVLGDTSYAQIEMSEVRQLGTDVARLIHQRLCGWVDPGQSASATIDTIASYAWPDPAQGGAMRVRRSRARRALDELRCIGWTIDQYARGKYRITRPAPA